MGWVTLAIGVLVAVALIVFVFRDDWPERGGAWSVEEPGRFLSPCPFCGLFMCEGCR